MNEDIIEKNAKAYDKISDEWQTVRGAMPMNECIIVFCKILPQKARILDAGCGTGKPVDSFLNGEGYLVIGIDVSEKMIEKARALKLKNARFEKCDFLNYEDDTPFDAIIAFDSLWHIDLKNQHKIYKKAASLLKCGGLFIFTHGKTHDEREGEMFGQTFYYAALDAEEIKDNLKKNSFEIITFVENFSEPTTGTRDLLVIAKKL